MENDITVPYGSDNEPWVWPCDVRNDWTEQYNIRENDVKDNIQKFDAIC